MGQRDLADLGSQLVQLIDRRRDRIQHCKLSTVARILAGNADPDPPQVSCHYRIVGHIEWHRGAVAWVMTSNDREEQSRILNIPGQRTDLIEGGSICHQPIAADPAIGGLEPHHTAQRCRLANAAARVRPQGPWDHPCRDRSRAAAARSSGDPAQIPRVSRGEIPRVLCGRTHRELVGVGLAGQHSAGGTQLAHDSSVVGRAETLKNP